MKKLSSWLLDYKLNVYSQTGEDGIIKKILETLPERDNWCVEFGAWDGKYLSNTCNLIENKNYKAVLIEADKNKFIELKANYINNGNVLPINQLVGFDKSNNLDHVLKTTPIPRNFDILSIDIDGNDYHAWQAMSEYNPKVIAIEYNPTIPTEVRFIQKKDVHVNQGSGLLSLVELGKEKGYELVSVLSYNAFFVKKEYYPLFEIENNSPHILRTDLSFITYLFSGYDGQVFLRGNQRLVWHNISLRETKVQHLPKILRKYPRNYTLIEKMLFNMYCIYKQISLFLRKVIVRIMYSFVKR